MRIFGVRMRMRDHHNGRAFSIEFGEQLHDLFAVRRV